MKDEEILLKAKEVIKSSINEMTSLMNESDPDGEINYALDVVIDKLNRANGTLKYCEKRIKKGEN